MRSKAAVLWGREQDWEILEIDLDPPKDHEVLVKWVAAGLCHSDQHLRTNDIGAPRDPAAGPDPRLFPLVGGHEGAGVVEAVGPGVTGVEPGDHVAASFFPICGRCRMCLTGHTNLCDLGAQTFSPGQISDGTPRYHYEGKPLNVMSKLGTFSEYGVVHEASLVKVGREFPLPAVALVSCGVTTGWGSAVYRADVAQGDVVVVVGVGGVGMNAVQGARMAGAKYVVAVDPVEFKQKSALDFGATHTAGSMEEALPLVVELTRGQLADARHPRSQRHVRRPHGTGTRPHGKERHLRGHRCGSADPGTEQHQPVRTGHVAEGGPWGGLRRRQPALRHPQPAGPLPGGPAQAGRARHPHLSTRPDQPGVPGHARRDQHPRRRRLRVSERRRRTCGPMS